MFGRRKFFAAVMSGVYLTSMFGVVGLVGGCGDSSESPKPSAEQEAGAKQAQEKMQEYMAKKKAEQKKH